MTPAILKGNCLEVLRTLNEESVHTCITSPPYYGLRQYDGTQDVTWSDGWTGALGHEPSPKQYVDHLVEVFEGVKRVLRSDGTLWVNIGDCYSSTPHQHGGKDCPGKKQMTVRGSADRIGLTGGIPAKNLIGIPWMLAFALRDAGWYLRSDIIWQKSNCMPSSVTDRPTKSHEYVFLLSKRPRYFYDVHATAEDMVSPNGSLTPRKFGGANKFKGVEQINHTYSGNDYSGTPTGKRRKRSVWTVPTAQLKGEHYASYPVKLIEPMILAGTSEKGCCVVCGAPHTRVMGRTNIPDPSHNGSRFDKGKTVKHQENRSQEGERFLTVTTGWKATCKHDAGTVPCTVLDPFVGSGTTMLAASNLSRDSIGIDLAYQDLQRERLGLSSPLKLTTEYASADDGCATEHGMACEFVSKDTAILSLG